MPGGMLFEERIGTLFAENLEFWVVNMAGIQGFDLT